LRKCFSKMVPQNYGKFKPALELLTIYESTKLTDNFFSVLAAKLTYKYCKVSNESAMIFFQVQVTPSTGTSKFIIRLDLFSEVKYIHVYTESYLS